MIASALLGQLKILINFAQVLSAMPVAYDGVPWPDNFKHFSLGLGVINLDFLGVLVGTSCSLSVAPLDRVTLHMTVPPMLVGAFCLAFAATLPRE